MSIQPELCLVLYPTAKGMGYVLCESPKELVNYGVAKVYPMREKFIKRLHYFIAKYRPTLIILKDYHQLDYKMSKRIVRLLEDFVYIAHAQNIPIHTYNRTQIREVFKALGKTSKYGICKSIVELYPELRHLMPDLRQHGDTEHYQMSLFDVFSLMLTHYYTN